MVVLHVLLQEIIVFYFISTTVYTISQSTCQICSPYVVFVCILVTSNDIVYYSLTCFIFIIFWRHKQPIGQIGLNFPIEIT